MANASTTSYSSNFAGHILLVKARDDCPGAIRCSNLSLRLAIYTCVHAAIIVIDDKAILVHTLKCHSSCSGQSRNAQSAESASCPDTRYGPEGQANTHTSIQTSSTVAVL
jgi:hypothetical protein